MRPEDVTAIILCGGSGSRLGGVDKPLVHVGGRTLIELVVEALDPQVGRVVLACGRDVAPYRALGHATVPDERPGEGPLGGIVSALPLVTTDWILTYPGDAPFADPRLVERLASAADAVGAAVPSTRGQRQNLTLLLSRERAAELARFYREGGRSLKVWLDGARIGSVDMADIADSFIDIDTPADLAAVARRPGHG